LGIATWLEKLFTIPDDQLPQKPVDVIIAVGSALSPDGSEASPQSAANAQKAAKLFMQGKARYILLSGGYGVYAGIKEAHAMAKVIADSGVSSSRVLLETRSARTWENARNTLTLMVEFMWQDAIVVCQPLHARRVRKTFRKVWGPFGKRVFVVKAEGQYGGASQRRFINPITFFIWELIALTYSKIKGYI